MHEISRYATTQTNDEGMERATATHTAQAKKDYPSSILPQLKSNKGISSTVFFTTMKIYKNCFFLFLIIASIHDSATAVAEKDRTAATTAARKRRKTNEKDISLEGLTIQQQERKKVSLVSIKIFYI